MKRAALWLLFLTSLSLSSPAGAQERGAPGQNAPANPHRGVNPVGGTRSIKTGVFPDPELPVGRLIVEVVKASPGSQGDAIPVPNANVEVVTAFQSIAEGMSQSAESQKTDRTGRAVFDELSTALRYSHSIRVHEQGATYDLPAFRASEKHGHRAVVQVYPVTNDPREAMVGMRGFIYVTLREGQFNFDVLYRVFNMGGKTWIPKDVTLSLPEEREAIDTESGEQKGGFEPASPGVRLTGTYPPGQKDVRFTFQVPRANSTSTSFTLDLPPHVAEQRVLVESTPNMELSVSGFEKPQKAEGPEGNRVLITRRVMQPGQGQLSNVTIEMSGLPVSGPGRWVAVAFAICLAIAGLIAALRQHEGPSPEIDEERDEARQILLDELVALDRARAQDEIGPKTYQTTRQRLLDALARLEDAEPGPRAGGPATPATV